MVEVASGPAPTGLYVSRSYYLVSGWIEKLNCFFLVRVLHTIHVLSLSQPCVVLGPCCTHNSRGTFGFTLRAKTEHVVPLVVAGLSSNTGTSSSPTSLPQDSSSTSSGPAKERSDDGAPGNWRDPPKTQNKNKKRDNDGASGKPIVRPPGMVRGVHRKSRRYRVPAPAHVSHDSDSERPTQVASRKHSIFTRFP